MKEFKYTDDVKNWLAPLGYQGFWSAVRPYYLVLQDYDHCEQQIADGEVSRETVLSVLKYMATDELKARFKLKDKPVTPWIKLVE